MIAANSMIIKAILTNAIFLFYYNSINLNKLRYQSYDFIIIGGGTAGSLIAARLSEIPESKVLLLERGGNAGNQFTDIPYIASFLADDPTLVTLYKSTPQTKSCLSTKGICSIATGNGFGGGSSHNGLLYVRGSPLDFDDWETKYGAKGWSYQSVLPYFKSTETCHRSKKMCSSPLHGTKPGGIFVTAQDDYALHSQLFLSAIEKAGFEIGDYNGPHFSRFSNCQVTVGRGKRSSSWNAFLEPVLKRPNLDVISFASVSKIIFDENKRAIGVSYLREGKKYEARVEREVILSAGAVDSPKILMLSGIGDKDELTSLGISPIVSHLPSVGRGFQDHPSVTIILETPFGQSPNMTFQDYAQYDKKQGLLTKDRKNLIVGFVTDEEASINSNDARMEYQYNLMFPGTQDPNGDITVHAFLTAPESRGSVRLQSNNPNDPPLINPNFFGVNQDYNIFKRGIKKFINFINQSEVLKEKGVKIKRMHVKGCGQVTPNTLSNDTFLDCYIRQRSFPGLHMSSSCRMGPENSPTSVVDPQLRLLGGIQNVRVIDASIMPQTTRGNTNAPTTMIAEKGSRMIMNDFF